MKPTTPKVKQLSNFLSTINSSALPDLINSSNGCAACLPVLAQAIARIDDTHLLHPTPIGKRLAQITCLFIEHAEAAPIIKSKQYGSYLSPTLARACGMLIRHSINYEENKKATIEKARQEASVILKFCQIHSSAEYLHKAFIDNGLEFRVPKLKQDPQLPLFTEAHAEPFIKNLTAIEAILEQADICLDITD